jgi:hypothetical protein
VLLLVDPSLDSSFELDQNKSTFLAQKFSHPSIINALAMKLVVLLHLGPLATDEKLANDQ